LEVEVMVSMPVPSKAGLRVGFVVDTLGPVGRLACRLRPAASEGGRRVEKPNRDGIASLSEGLIADLSHG
jgi:hypothetical protein